MRKLISSLMLIILSPLILIIVVLIFVTDGMPIIFRQERIGKNNRKFMIYKFRTMKNETPDIPTHLFTDYSNHFIPAGNFLRKYSLDEIPQLINILKGDMLFIGPRPALYNQNDLINHRTKDSIHKLKPGITGWAQVNGRDELTISQKVSLDKFYLENQSINLDIKILIMTLYKVIKKDGVVK
mgnify:CR=1 FL=1|tara:strand:- start:3366 stop:3914 length:549 start_codon:yes stop_codon:yes gene_type:complete